MNKFKTTAKLEALFNQITSGKMTNDRAKVFNLVFVSNVGVTIEQLKAKLPSVKNISGRLSELEDLGLIYKAGRLGNYSLFLFEKNPNNQILRRQQKHAEKYRQCVKRLKAEFTDYLTPELKSELNSTVNNARHIQTQLF